MEKLLLRSAGYEPYSEGLDDRKQTFTCRLIPLVEANFNMVELGPVLQVIIYLQRNYTLCYP